MSDYCYDSLLGNIESMLVEINNNLFKLIEIFDQSKKCSCCKKPFDQCSQYILGQMEARREFFTEMKNFRGKLIEKPTEKENDIC